MSKTVSLPRGLDAIKRRPDIYLRDGVTSVGISACLTDDALQLGASLVQVEEFEDWRIVSADIDWLCLPVSRIVPLDRIFVGMYVHPTRINGIRAEALVGAFATAAFIATSSEVRVVVGDIPIPAEVSLRCCLGRFVRSVAFSLA